jgi:hypothetical protein
MTRVTANPWFGPKRHVGWGWRAITWQGWVVSAVFIASLVGVLAVLHGTALGLGAAMTLLVAYVSVVLVTGDPPGRAHSRP